MDVGAVAGDELLDPLAAVRPPGVHAAATTTVTATAAVHLSVLLTALYSFALNRGILGVLGRTHDAP